MLYFYGISAVIIALELLALHLVYLGLRDDEKEWRVLQARLRGLNRPIRQRLRDAGPAYNLTLTATSASPFVPGMWQP